MDVTFIDQTEKVTESEIDLVSKLLVHAANKLNLPEDAMMSVTFMDNAHIQEINRDYRGKDMPTDVISFAIEEDDDLEFFFDEDIDLPDEPRDLGDIMISIERAKEQAEDFGHSYERELGFLAVHGFLHINGYDHMTKEDEEEMFGLQKEILDSYGLKRG